MFAGVKFIPREKIDKVEDEKLEYSIKERKKCSSRKEKHRRKEKSSRYSSSDDEGLERIEKRSRKKKWYSSDEYSSSESESEGSSNEDESKQNKKKGKSKRKTKSKRSNGDYSDDEDSDRSKKRSRSREDGRRKSKESRGQKDIVGDDLLDSGRGTDSLKDKEIVRKEMGLEWMLRPGDKRDKRPVMAVDDQTEEIPAEEIKKVNPRELNPYLKDDGSGYPEDTDGSKAAGDQLLSSSVVGDGGASWRLKALKRAQEQAAREGRMLEEVVEERWGSVGQLAVSVTSRTVAPSRAHLHAIKDRRRGLTEERQTGPENESERDIKKNNGRDYLKDKPLQHPKMREPKVKDFLSWGKRKSQNLSSKDASVISAAVSSLNKFSNDGSFMHEFLQQQSNDPGGSVQGNVESELVSSQADQPSEGSVVIKDGLSANQLAAKAFQLRMKGKHEEANKLLQEAENIKAKQGAGDDSIRPRNEGSTSRYIMQDISIRKKKDEDDANMHLAQTITKNKKYTADDEYDFEVGPSRKARKKGERNENKVTHKNIHEKRILTQQERCLFCCENPNGPKHLIVSIANFTYLMLPQWQPVAPGHCCIVPLQHESATRTVDDNVWEEIRNFKKCLIMMFAKQEKDVVFLETVMRLSQQRRHCLIECIPMPREIAKEAPLYFKKAIDEAEDEWSQHNAKKLIDTSEKGLRGSIPKNFPYFHVEFGLNKGFVHVIDDEEQFKSNLGLNVIRGMLQLAEEDMYRRRRYESADVQKEAVKSFLRDWEPFDWTKQLH